MYNDDPLRQPGPHTRSYTPKKGVYLPFLSFADGENLHWKLSPRSGLRKYAPPKSYYPRMQPHSVSDQCETFFLLHLYYLHHTGGAGARTEARVIR